MKDVVAKYDAVAERYTETDYADPQRYYARRARSGRTHGDSSYVPPEAR
jgi:hypothetical protein